MFLLALLAYHWWLTHGWQHGRVVSGIGDPFLQFSFLRYAALGKSQGTDSNTENPAAPPVTRASILGLGNSFTSYNNSLGH
ncbi:hypothetical protein F4680DRAFT_261728 [Xylaria scruposa]|nr:hypothetical protein F4680DRAFT_261728 [Xylaria scruposa]